MITPPEIEKEQVLILLHKKQSVWLPELVGILFRHTYDYVLTPTERVIVDEKIEGTSNTEIANKLGNTLKSVKQRICDIKRKYRNQIEGRVDHHPSLRKKQGFVVRHRKIKIKHLRPN